MGPQQVSEVTEAKVSALQAEGEVASKHFFLRNAAGGCCMQVLLTWRVFNSGQSALLSSLRTLALLNPLLVRHSHSSSGHFASDRCEMALLLKGRLLLHMSSFFKQGQLPLLRCSKAVSSKDSLHKYNGLCGIQVHCFSRCPSKVLSGRA